MTGNIAFNVSLASSTVIIPADTIVGIAEAKPTVRPFEVMASAMDWPGPDDVVALSLADPL